MLSNIWNVGEYLMKNKQIGPCSIPLYPSSIQQRWLAREYTQAFTFFSRQLNKTTLTTYSQHREKTSKQRTKKQKQRYEKAENICRWAEFFSMLFPLQQVLFILSLDLYPAACYFHSIRIVYVQRLQKREICAFVLWYMHQQSETRCHGNEMKERRKNAVIDQ